MALNSLFEHMAAGTVRAIMTHRFPQGHDFRVKSVLDRLADKDDHLRSTDPQGRYEDSE